MKKALLIIAFLVSLMFLHAEKTPETHAKKNHRKEISVRRLPKTASTFIYSNLPRAKITRVIRQRGNPHEKYIVTFVLMTKPHTMVFDKHGVFVRLVKVKRKTSVPHAPD